MKKNVGSAFTTLGCIFVVIGFVLQDFTLSFESGLFNLGLIFALSGVVSTVLEKKSKQIG